jgi:hypothetical protein
LAINLFLRVQSSPIKGARAISPQEDRALEKLRRLQDAHAGGDMDAQHGLSNADVRALLYVGWVFATIPSNHAHSIPYAQAFAPLFFS